MGNNPRHNRILLNVWLEDYELNALMNELNSQTNDLNLQVIGDIIKTANGRGDVNKA